MTELSDIDKALVELTSGALFVANHSGGKDSQATLIKLLEFIPVSQLVVVHATLGEVEWPGALEKAREQAENAGCDFIIAEARKTLLQMVEHRFSTRPTVPSWPSSATRQCTSDLKRGPIRREVRRYAVAKGFNRIVSAMGMRAQESSNRAKLPTWQLNNECSKAGRNWFDWLPIHSFKTNEVFETIAKAGQEPHWAYSKGNERLSCVFCILGSAGDAKNGAVHRPELYQKYVQLEEKTGWTMHQSGKNRRTLPMITGLSIEQAFAENTKLKGVSA